MKKLVRVLVMLGILLSIYTQIVQATSFKFDTIPNKMTAKNGDTIKIDLKLSEIDVGEEGINTFQCMLKYDEQVFEDIKVESNDKKSNTNYGKMLAVLLATGVTKNQEIGTVTLKIKDDVNVKSGDITFTEASSNDGKNIIPTSDKTVTIKIKGNFSNSDKKNDNNISNSKEINDEKEKTNTSTNTKNSYEGTKIAKNPESQTGNYTYYIIAFAVCMTVIIIFAITKFAKKIRNKER